jgi:hypothetical protein
MDKEETKKAIAVMQAYVDGADIQWDWAGRLEEGWRIPATYTWNWDYRKYRVKPKKPLIGSFWPPEQLTESFKGIELTDDVIEALEKAEIPYAD